MRRGLKVLALSRGRSVTGSTFSGESDALVLDPIRPSSQTVARARRGEGTNSIDEERATIVLRTSFSN